MSTFLTNVDAWVPAAVLAAIMLAIWAVAWFGGRRLQPEACEGEPSKFSDATLALLGLLLAFTFSMSLAKHDQRRQTLVTDSNAIGDFYTCVSLLKEPVRGQLQTVVREYVEHRLGIAAGVPDEAALQAKLLQVQDMQNQMQALVASALEQGTPIAVPLVNTLNALTSSHVARLAAVRDRLPGSVVLLFLLAAVVSMAVVGRQQGTTGEHRHGATAGFIVLVCMVVWVTLDLNQPNRGFIKVSQEPLQRLLAGMAK